MWKQSATKGGKICSTVTPAEGVQERMKGCKQQEELEREQGYLRLWAFAAMARHGEEHPSGRVMFQLRWVATYIKERGVETSYALATPVQP